MGVDYMLRGPEINAIKSYEKFVNLVPNPPDVSKLKEIIAEDHQRTGR